MVEYLLKFDKKSTLRILSPGFFQESLFKIPENFKLDFKT